MTNILTFEQVGAKWGQTFRLESFETLGGQPGLDITNPPFYPSALACRVHGSPLSFRFSRSGSDGSRSSNGSYRCPEPGCPTEVSTDTYGRQT